MIASGLSGAEANLPRFLGAVVETGRKDRKKVQAGKWFGKIKRRDLQGGEVGLKGWSMLAAGPALSFAKGGLPAGKPAIPAVAGIKRNNRAFLFAVLGKFLLRQWN